MDTNRGRRARETCLALSNAGRNGPGRRRGADECRAETIRAVRRATASWRRCARLHAARWPRCTRLSDFSGPAVVIAWFPRAFTPGVYAPNADRSARATSAARAGRAVLRGQRGLAGHERGFARSLDLPFRSCPMRRVKTARAYGVLTSSGFAVSLDVLHRPRRPHPRHRSPGACVRARARRGGPPEGHRPHMTLLDRFRTPSRQKHPDPDRASRVRRRAPAERARADRRRRARRRGRPRAPRRRREAARPRGAVGHRPRRCGRRRARRCAEHAARYRARRLRRHQRSREPGGRRRARGRRQDAGADCENVGAGGHRASCAEAARSGRARTVARDRSRGTPRSSRSARRRSRVCTSAPISSPWPSTASSRTSRWPLSIDSRNGPISNRWPHARKTRRPPSGQAPCCASSMTAPHATPRPRPPPQILRSRSCR